MIKQDSRHIRFLFLILLATTAYGAAASGADLSIYELQYTTDASGESPYYGQICNLTGGVVTHVWHGFNNRVYLQDPSHTTWGAIVVKDGQGGELADNVSVGDWVSFSDIFVDEFGGTTFLQYRRSLAPDVSFTVKSTGNNVPAPAQLTGADILYPVNHARTERFESMVVTLENVTVGQMDLGGHQDNYELIHGGDIAWATDYMNVDAGGPYDPRIATGTELLSITGIVEQNSFSGRDYYQLNTRSARDVVPEPGTLAVLLAGMALACRRRQVDSIGRCDRIAGPMTHL